MYYFDKILTRANFMINWKIRLWSSLFDSSITKHSKGQNFEHNATSDLFINIEKDELSRSNSPARLITDSNAPPEVHRIVIEFNQKATYSVESDLDTSPLRNLKPTLQRQPSSNLKGYLSA